MLLNRLLISTMPLALMLPAQALAQSGTADKAAGEETASRGTLNKDVVVTAVARGRDRLDSAISTSSLGQDEILKAAPRSTAEIFRNIPGLRSESSGGDGNANISIRGLPIASGGAKFLQLQEDGLPVLEFGDITFGNADIFLRADMNVASVDAIRGGSASTFSSNSPGGVVNMISKTGDVTGGAIMATAGLDYGEYRLDFDYGAKVSDTLRFHLGGFYHQGEGPRRVGYDGTKGGQIKLNVTKEFSGGYIRFYGKFLNDRSAAYLPNPVRVTGTDADPRYESVPGFDIARDALLSRYDTSNVTLDGQNNPVIHDKRDGMHPVVNSFGVETRFDVAGWTVTDRFRYADISGRFISNFPAAVDGAAATATALGGAGATLRYASGPSVGQVIANPAGLNGNGLLARVVVFDVNLNSLDNVANDLRASRVFDVGGGELTTTAGFYKSRQTVDTDWLWTSTLMDVRGQGRAALVDVFNAGGVAQTQNGYYAFGADYFGGCCRRSYRVDYDVNAPFGSLNYKIGRVALGASIRYDFGSARGAIFGADLGGGRVGTTVRDMNGDGVVSAAERRVSVIPLSSPAPVDYDWHYLSYSSGINFRVSEPFAMFVRYSRGARANADRLLFGPAVSTVDGHLVNADAAVDYVQQAEAGLKYRRNGMYVNLTGFWAKTEEQNYEATRQVFIDRKYRAYGLELDGAYTYGPFSLTGGATWTDAKIVSDALNPGVVGNTPRRQARLIFQATPQVEVGRLMVGANAIGTTSSYAQDSNQLKLPGYTVVNGFVQFRATDRILVSLNSNNLFDSKGFTEAEDAVIPANGIVRARSINARTTSLSVRVGF
ncbi:TonB-dependent receptor domain-containing protein [Sphingomonas pseudosanguinis]|uniref:TonB-dependent receptor domain-containing protein n=1 Tax=Sphingomonas pseudosanguinis TaxID=413712 RepID=UPI003F83708D